MKINPLKTDLSHLNFEEFKHSMIWLYKGRVFTILPCFVVYVACAMIGEFLPDITWLYIIVVFEGLVNTPSDFILKRFFNAHKENILVLITLAIDVIAATIALHLIGLQEALFFGALYLVIITFAGILSTKRITYIIATFSTLCLVSITLLEYFKIVPHITTIGINLTPGQNVAWLSSHTLFFYITAYLTSFYSNPIKLRGKFLETQLKKSHTEAISALLKALKVKDPYTESHSYNVAWYSMMIAKEMDIEPKIINDMQEACFLHDIGKIGIDDSILTKETSLSVFEWEKIKLHPGLGSEIITALSGTENVAEMIIQEHEHYDGSGYPRGLKGNEICLGAQIIAVGDAFDVLTSGRPYKKAISPDLAMEILTSQRGKYFSPEIVDCFAGIYEGNKDYIASFIDRHKTNAGGFPSV